MKKLFNLLFICSFCIILLCGFIKPLLKPNSINYTEKRTANLLPKFTQESFLNGSFQNQMELAYSDQIPLANTLKIFEKTLDILLKKIYYNNSPKDTYINLSGVYQYNDNLVYSKYNFAGISANLDEKIENINNVVSNLKNIDFYLYYIEKDTDIDFTDNSKLNAYEYLQENLNSKIVSNKLSINNFNEYANYFYKTDHHWNYKGSYKAYSEIMSILSNDKPIKYDEEICLNSTMSGSKASQIGGTLFYKEQFCAYTFNLPEHDIYSNNIKVENYGNYKNLIQNNPPTISYADYYGWDAGLLEFDYHNSSKENLLIIGESYDNAINELLASHYNHTYNVDLRNYLSETGEKFDIYKFIKEKNISKVLLIGSIDYYASNTFKLEGEK